MPQIVLHYKHPTTIRRLRGGGVCGTGELPPAEGGDIAMNGYGKWFGIVLEPSPVSVPAKAVFTAAELAERLALMAARAEAKLPVCG